MADVPAAMRPAFVAYLNRKYATCVLKTVSSIATRLAHFGRYLAAADPTLTSLSQLDRRHIEPFITSLTTATNSVTGDPITVADRIRRIHTVVELPGRDHRKGVGRRTTAATDLPHRAASPTAHLRHRPDQRRGVLAGVDGPGRTLCG